jgi:hypothetical protein
MTHRVRATHTAINTICTKKHPADPLAFIPLKKNIGVTLSGSDINIKLGANDRIILFEGGDHLLKLRDVARLAIGMEAEGCIWVIKHPR